MDAQTHVIEEAIKRGIPRERIIFTDVAPKEEHTFRGCLADVFLDTPACNAHTTGTDILWAGTPMVTLPKKNMASRVAASLLSAIDAPELIASDEHEYEEIAVDLGLHPEKLRALKRKLLQNRLEKPLFDTKR
jgi:protein O-GlcNAc transferase